METETSTTAAEAGIGGDEQVRIALRTILANGGVAQMQQIYQAVEARLKESGRQLSKQGRASLRFYVNRVAVKAGYIYPFDRKSPGWGITPEGREFAETSPDVEKVVNVDTEAEEETPSTAVRAAAFERYVLDLLKAMYPNYAWYHQGVHKVQERGLDFVGDRFAVNGDEPARVGVQVKLHERKHAPVQIEWLKFQAGCFARRVDRAVFITTGTLTAEQRREAAEAGVLIIEDRAEITRLAKMHNVPEFGLYK